MKQKIIDLVKVHFELQGFDSGTFIYTYGNIFDRYTVFFGEEIKVSRSILKSNVSMGQNYNFDSYEEIYDFLKSIILPESRDKKIEQIINI